MGLVPFDHFRMYNGQVSGDGGTVTVLVQLIFKLVSNPADVIQMVNPCGFICALVSNVIFLGRFGHLV